MYIEDRNRKPIRKRCVDKVTTKDDYKDLFIFSLHHERVIKEESLEILEYSDLDFTKYILREALKNGIDINIVLDDMYINGSDEYEKAFKKIADFCNLNDFKLY